LTASGDGFLESLLGFEVNGGVHFLFCV
jgi:hypothetical protein